MRKREKLKDFHDTFEDEFEDFDEVRESNHENDGARWFMLRQPEVGTMWKLCDRSASIRLAVAVDG